ncbi:MAG: TonB-dependent receptor, plug, partial [Bryobacterales bacterium]|nr:TonB-dependent receptor, plug [Bryobacterales bacterium]
SNIPPLRYNLFGASVGGPVVKDKTFFFFTYEGRRQVAPTNRAVNVPTLAEAQGDYSGASYIVRDPVTGNPFPGNVIPANRLDPVGSKLALFYPAPNVPGAASGKGNFNANTSSRTSPNDYVARVDHTFNENNRLYGRFLAEPSTSTTSALFPVAAADPFATTSLNYYYNASGTYYHNFSPGVINEARYTYTKRKAFAIGSAAGTNIASQIGLTGTDPSFFPTVVVQGFQTIGAPSQQQRLQGPIRSDAINDNLTIVRNKHTIKLGGEYRYSSNLDKYSPTAGGSFTFNNVATGSALAALQLGWVQQASLLATDPILSRADSYGFYIQDDWRVSPKLTLNLGVRWDIDQPRWEKNNRQNSFDPLPINPVSNTPGIITFSGLNGVSRFAHGWDLNNIGPRIGFAYKATDQWVVRGGGALLFAGEYDQATPIVANTGFSRQGSFVSPDNGVTAAFLLRNGLPATSSPAAADLTSGFGAVAVGARPTTAVSFFNQNRRTGYLYQASLDLQRQFAGNLLIDIGYLGTFGHHLPAPDALSINQVPTNLLRSGNTQSLRPFPQFSNVQIIAADIGASKFNGLNLGVEKRYSGGLLFKANYTVAKLLDNAASRNERAGYPGVGAFTDYYNQANNWGRSGNDIRQRLIFSTVYELPVGRRRQIRVTNKALDFVAGGWSIGAVSELATGTALSPAMLTNTSNSFSDGQRPNVAGDPYLESPTISRWFNTAAFAAPAVNTFGNAGRTFGNGPGMISVDASLLKDFSVSERIVVQFRAEALNILNHPNFANPNTQFGSPTFGQITSLISGNQSRILQLGARLSF